MQEYMQRIRNPNVIALNTKKKLSRAKMRERERERMKK